MSSNKDTIYALLYGKVNVKIFPYIAAQTVGYEKIIFQ